jgi:queuine/archaeosine tRNA-ribosyltransferase
MKLMANRDQDRVHLRDLIEVGLVGRDMMTNVPPELAARLDALLTEAGR